MKFKHLMISLTLTIAIFSFLVLCGSCASADNLLKNGDFSALDQDGMPEEWYTDAYYTETGYTLFSVITGDKQHPVIAEIRNIGENDARFAQTVSVEPETLYCLSGYIRADDITGGHGANLSVEGVYAFSEKVYETNGEWQFIEYYGETGPEQHSVTVFARLGGYSGISKGRADFASLSLTKADKVPGDLIADLWYREDTYDQYPDDEEEFSNTSSSAWPWLILTGIMYTGFALLFLMSEKSRHASPEHAHKKQSILLCFILFVSLCLRIYISSLVEGYMVDVNCFLSWGQTMASYGPVQFYEATSFCDYPPLYTYILGLNSTVTGLLGGGTVTARIVFRFIPSLCDILACWFVYHLLIVKKGISTSSAFAFVCFLAFNPAFILNSAAWGQMDSVLCLLLLAVAVYSQEDQWLISLPLYVIAVLIKPQALMLGPLGLTYILITWIKNKGQRKSILWGTLVSIAVLIAGVLPFTLRQEWNWLINLYAKTLASYPYATVNTANFYYLLGANWSSVDLSAGILAPILLSAGCIGFAFWWHHCTGSLRLKIIEFYLSICFAAAFIICFICSASWTVVGVLAMVYAFIQVVSTAIRKKDIRLLTWLGGLLFILLYVFGIKMHERYLFPALFLLAAAYVQIKDRRILYILLLYTFTVFVNEGIVLDNSIRLGSSLGHLNKDTAWLADILSILNISGAIYAVWLNTQFILSAKELKPNAIAKPRSPLQWKCDHKLHWNLKDTIILLSVTSVYTFITLFTLGSTRAPQTFWSSSSPEEQIVFDLGHSRNNVEILYFGQVNRNDFSFSSSDDGINWSDEIWAQMDQGQCWKWKYVTQFYENGDGKRTYYNSDSSNIIHFSGRFIRLTSQQLGLKLNEILFRDINGTVLPARILNRTGAEPDSNLYSDPQMLLDEQDTMERLPAFPETPETSDAKIQPSWWNSTYFDEIYHARTAYEFTQGTVPYETSHPPLGKVIMSWFVSIFGMTPFGWRFAGALAGILMLPGIYLLGKQLTKKTWIAAVACGWMALDCMHLTQTQIATIDSFPVLFIIFSYFFMLRFLQTDYLKERISFSFMTLGMSGLFMGLSISSKWIGIYAGAGLAVLFFWHLIRIVKLYVDAQRMRCNPETSTTDKALLSNNLLCDITNKEIFRRILLICIGCIGFFVVIPIITYLLSYIPYFAYNSKRIHSIGEYINQVWRAQVSMFNYHSTDNLGMDHPFYSPWWEWPIIGKPMYYASQQYIPHEFPVHFSIFSFGNPVIWFGGLAGLLCCVLHGVFSRRQHYINSELVWHIHSNTYNPEYPFILIGVLAQYLPWVLVPRGTYIYHYFASIPFLILSVCLCFSEYDSGKTRGITRILAGITLFLAVLFFIILFPYASGISVSSGWLDIGRNILKIWY